MLFLLVCAQSVVRSYVDAATRAVVVLDAAFATWEAALDDVAAISTSKDYMSKVSRSSLSHQPLSHRLSLHQIIIVIIIPLPLILPIIAPQGRTGICHRLVPCVATLLLLQHPRPEKGRAVCNQPA